MRFSAAFALVLAATFFAAPAHAGNGWTSSFTLLGGKGAAKNGQSRGTAARKVELDLGNLRMTTGKLPGGIVTKKERMRLRAIRAEARRRALDAAKRDKAKQN